MSLGQVLIGAMSIITLLLAACGSTSSPTSNSGGTPKMGGTLNVGLNADITTLDPLTSSSLYDRQVMLNIYDTLVSSDAQNNIKPDLATSWTYDSPTSLTFTLRTDVMFQDGTPFNAAAVVTNIERYLGDKASPRYSELSSVDHVTAVDPSHVTFVLKQPFAPLLATLTDRAGMILSPAVITALGNSGLANAPVNAGSGPFTFVEWVKGDHLTIKKNPHYWMKDAQGNAMPYLNQVIYKPITNETTMLAQLQTNTIQVSQGISPNDVATVKSNSSLVYNQIPGLGFNGFELNTKMPPLDNVHVRRAIAYGVNPQEILTSVLKNIGVISSGPIPQSSWAYPQGATPPFTYNVTQAKAELAQSGLTNVSFTMLIASGSPLTTQLAQFLQAELQTVGITLNLQPETFTKILSDTAAYNYQAALIGWSGRVDPDGNMYGWFHTGGGFNDMQYSNTQVDQYLDDARTNTDQTARAKDYQQAQTQIQQDEPYIFLYDGVSSQITSSAVKNFVLLPTGMMVFTTTYLG